MMFFCSHLALHIDSSATYDRRKPSRGFRRWKALPEIKETVVFSSEFQSCQHDILLIFPYTNITNVGFFCTII